VALIIESSDECGLALGGVWRCSLEGCGVAYWRGVAQLTGGMWHRSLEGCGVAHWRGVA
jgi:hypothetical protein